MVCGATVENAAQKAGVSVRTAHRRLADPAFRQQLAEVRSDMLKRTVSMLAAAGLESVKTLVNLQGSASASVRLGAARAILDLGIKLRDRGQVGFLEDSQVTEVLEVVVRDRVELAWLKERETAERLGMNRSDHLALDGGQT